MRPPSRSPVSALAAALVLAGCAFRPEGGASPGDDDGGGVVADAADQPDAPVAIDARVVDARPVDAAPPFDLETCPDGYRPILNTSSRWRMIDPLPWAAAAAMCRGHLPGATHLAVFSGMGERDAVGAALFFGGEFRRTWLGVWHDGLGVNTVTGEPVYPGIELTTGQAVSWVRDLVSPFRADPASTAFAALCECDGRAAP